MMVRTRFAPSPTGHLHVGGLRTALFSYLFARSQGGEFVLRIEDTDRKRSSQESVDAILEGLSWLGMASDKEPVYQSRRNELYAKTIDTLLKSGDAYHCFCSPEELAERRAAQIARKESPRYDGRCRERKESATGGDPVVRFRNPQAGAVVVKDLVQGHVSFANDMLDDLIIARSDGTPTYNLTVVVDDLDMGITHVIRGDDHLNNTPRQVNVMRALNAEPPKFAHIPMILGPDGSRLSKRHGATSVLAFREQGIVPEALLNYLVRLGWSHGDQEIFDLNQMISLFSLEGINKSAAVFDYEKLLWVNQQYLQSLSAERLADELAWHFAQSDIPVNDGPPLTEIVDAQRTRARTLVEMCEKSVVFYKDFEEYDPKAAKKVLRPVVEPVLEDAKAALGDLAHWDKDSICDAIDRVARERELNLAKVAQPLRVAVCGSGVSPAIELTLALMGQERTLSRIDDALAYVRARASEPRR